MMSVDALLGDLTEQAAGILAEHHGDTEHGGEWREDPVGFREFVESKGHLGLPPFFPLQYQAVENLLGTDPKRIFQEPEPPRVLDLTWVKAARSSNVRQFAYAASQLRLYVQFRDGAVYGYDGIEQGTVDELQAARSKGKYLNAEVKHRYAHRRLDTPVDELVETIGSRAARAYQMAVLLWGKGSGKDYICSVVMLYLVYVLLCLRNPQAYLTQAPGENIDVVNVAYNADQAKKVFFAKFTERLWRWAWLKEHFDVWESGRRKWKDNAGKPKVEVNDGEVIWPRKIRCFSRHAQNESYEGLNVVAWLMDEASAFLTKTKEENADAIFQTLRTSATSRFGKRWVGFIISYPRHADDFTCKKLREAQRHPERGIYGDGPRATWEVNENTARQERVEVRPGHWVPVEFINDYLDDVEAAMGRYEAKPPAAVDALIKEPQRLWDAVQEGRKPMIEWEERVTRRESADGNERQFAAVHLTRLGTLPKGARLFIHGDPARSSDSFAIALGHGVPATVMTYVPAGEVLKRATLEREGLEPETMIPWERDVVRTVIDALIVWRPDPRQRRHVDLLNVQDVLWQIIDHYGRGRIGMVTFDQYDSAETIQRLEAKKVNAENEAWSNPFQHRIYRGARSAFYNDLVTLPDVPSVTSEDARQPGVIYELTRVQEIDGHKIDHPEGGSKDLADAVVRIIEHVTGAARGGRLSFGKLGDPQSPDTGKGPVPGKTTNPKRTPSPITPAHRALEEKRRAERPEGEIHAGTGEVIPARRGKLAMGSIRGR